MALARETRARIPIRTRLSSTSADGLPGHGRTQAPPTEPGYRRRAAIPPPAPPVSLRRPGDAVWPARAAVPRPRRGRGRGRGPGPGRANERCAPALAGSAGGSRPGPGAWLAPGTAEPPPRCLTLPAAAAQGTAPAPPAGAARAAAPPRGRPAAWAGAAGHRGRRDRCSWAPGRRRSTRRGALGRWGGGAAPHPQCYRRREEAAGCAGLDVSLFLSALLSPLLSVSLFLPPAPILHRSREDNSLQALTASLFPPATTGYFGKGEGVGRGSVILGSSYSASLVHFINRGGGTWEHQMPLLSGVTHCVIVWT